ncbi:hypothetical protein EK21DRAFT_118663 [Setomelanomma holmii]|uniref:Glycosyltransferase family 34 protein n=1 Tax=Setomelanomma holmii TaxID=210430 RepID=A0A9P4GY03_9PLEO|nr:hypothetical protein EK21DRAFT_118663 [Setomelanomma holmii]
MATLSILLSTEALELVMSREHSKPCQGDLSSRTGPAPWLQFLPRTSIRTLKCLLLATAVLAMLSMMLLSWSITKLLPPPTHMNNHDANNKAKGMLQLGPSQLDSDNTPTIPRAIIGKVSASFGPPDPIYEAAIATHVAHNSIHNYPFFILREHMLPGLWSKHAYLLTVLGHELAKPVDYRLRWLVWVDRDTIIMNPDIALGVFLTPEPAFAHINLISTRDRNGLNNGVFFARPEVVLKYTEQSAMEEMLKRPYYNTSVAYVPQRWFNGFPPSLSSSGHSARMSRHGSLLIHFASNRDGKRPERMAHWQSKREEWHKPYNETGYVKEIGEYWGRVGKGEDMKSVIEDIAKRSW